MYCNGQSFTTHASNNNWDIGCPVAMVPVFIMPQPVMQQLPSRQRRQHQIAHPTEPQFGPVATDEKLAKKLQRLQRCTQRRQKIQQQQQQQYQQQQQQMQQIVEEEWKSSPSVQQSTSVSLRSLPNHLCNDDSMEVLLSSVGLQQSVVRCEFWPGDTFGEAVLHLDSANATDKCIEYFQGRQWGRLRGPPHPFVHAERIASIDSSADTSTGVVSVVPSLVEDVPASESHGESVCEQKIPISEEEFKLWSPSRKPLRPRGHSDISSTEAPSQASSRASSPVSRVSFGPMSPKLRWADIESDDDEDWAIVGFE